MYVLIHVAHGRLDKDADVMVYEDYGNAKSDMDLDIERTLGDGNHDDDGFRTDCFYRFDSGKEGLHESVESAGADYNEWHIYEV